MKSTFLKVMAILALVFGIIGVIGGISTVISYSGIPIPMAGTVLGIVSSILMIVAGLAGIKISVTPEKAGMGVIWGIILIAIAVVALIVEMNEFELIAVTITSMLAAGGLEGYNILGMNWTYFSGLIIPVLYLIAALLFKSKVKKSNQ